MLGPGIVASAFLSKHITHTVSPSVSIDHTIQAVKTSRLKRVVTIATSSHISATEAPALRNPILLPRIQNNVSLSYGAAYPKFAARCTAAGSTLTGADAINYANLLTGLTTDGLINPDGTSSYFDALYVLAAPNTTVALLNLISGNFNLSVVGAPTFVANRGYTGVAGSSTVYLNTGFVPSSAGGHYQQNDAHISMWSNTNIVGGADQVGIGNATSPGVSTEIYARFTDGNAYFRINDSTTNVSTGPVMADTIGHYIATRSSSTVQKAYKNAVDLGMVSVGSAANSTFQFTLLAWNFNNSRTRGFSGQLSAASIGGNLPSLQVALFYNRLATFRTAVGL